MVMPRPNAQTPVDPTQRPAPPPQDDPAVIVARAQATLTQLVAVQESVVTQLVQLSSQVAALSAGNIAPISVPDMTGPVLSLRSDLERLYQRATFS